MANSIQGGHFVQGICIAGIMSEIQSYFHEVHEAYIRSEI